MIPRAALLLGLAGLIPFIWGALTILSADLGDWSDAALGRRFTGATIALQYGTVILAFMSGVLWGFSTKAEGQGAAVGYVLSVIPALWAFFIAGPDQAAWAIYLIAGFVGLLGLDWTFWRQELAPGWWMRLRLILTTVVVLCLAIVVI